MKRVCVVVNSRANYARIKSFMAAADKSASLELKLLVGASGILDRFGDVSKIIRNDGFVIDGLIHSVVEGSAPVAMAKSTGLGIIETSTHLETIRPDFVVTVADRYETLATAVAASYMNIPLVHTQGGEVSGSIDESVRHAITKLAHIHFVATIKSRENVRRLGEEDHRIVVTGCPAIDLVANLPKELKYPVGATGNYVGDTVSLRDPFVLVAQHPVTYEYASASQQISQTFEAVSKLVEDGFGVVWFWPNIDAGSDNISRQLRRYREAGKAKSIMFIKNLDPEDYGILLSRAACVIGNSSSGIRECNFLGVPSVNIGNRQLNREQGANVVNVDVNAKDIYRAAQKQIKVGAFPGETIFGSGDAGERMARHLESVDEVRLDKKLVFPSN